MVQECAIDCFTVYERYLTDISYLCYHGGVRRIKSMEGNREIGAVVSGIIRTCYLSLNNTPVSTVSFDFRQRRGEPRAWTKCLSSL